MTNKLDTLYLMKLFSAICQFGSFSAAAAQLQITASKATKDIQYLEQQVATTLLNRTTRNISLTDAGELYYLKSQEIIELHEQLLDSLRNQKHVLAGDLRIAAPELWGEVVLTPIMLAFKQRHPNVRFIADFSNEPSDLLRDNIHIAFRSTQLTSEPYIARYISDDDYVMCASPDYLTHSPDLTTPEDLLRHKLIVLSSKGRITDKITFQRGDQILHQHLLWDMALTHKKAMMHAVTLGLGIAVLPRYLVAQALAQGTLVEVLSGYKIQGSSFYALYTQRRKDSNLVNQFIDFVIENVRASANSPTNVTEI